MALRSYIEAQYPPLDVVSLPKADAIVVLGGAMNPPTAYSHFSDLGPGADRVWHGFRLFRAERAPVLLLSGGSDADISSMPEAEAMKELLQDFGVPPEAMLIEGASRNTRENARLSAHLLQERGMHTIILVTSALHMGRAIEHFRQQGLKVVPAATDHEVRPVHGVLAYLPDAAALEGSGRAIKEWVGQWIW